MNNFALQEGVDPIDLDTTKTDAQKKKDKKAKRKAKRDLKNLPPAERKIEEEKLKYKEAYDCLMFSQCLIQYAKYGNYIPFENMGTTIDFRAAQQFLFFVIYSILTGALSSPKQQRGLSFSRAIGIVFVLNELEQLIHYQETIEHLVGEQKDTTNPSQQGGAVNQRIEIINNLFGPTFCVFEKIVVQRLFYFLVFNIACSVSECYTKEEKT